MRYCSTELIVPRADQ